MQNLYALNQEEIDLVRAYRRMSTAHRTMVYQVFHKIAISTPLPMPELDARPSISLVAGKSHP